MYSQPAVAIAPLQFVLQELVEWINCYGVIIRVTRKIKWFSLLGCFSPGFSWLFERQSHLLFSHYLYISWMYVYVYIDFIYCCSYMWSLCFPANCYHKALVWTVLRKDCEDLLLNLKLQLCRKMSAFPDLVLMIKQETEVSSIYSVSSMWEITGISYVFSLEIP